MTTWADVNVARDSLHYPTAAARARKEAQRGQGRCGDRKGMARTQGGGVNGPQAPGPFHLVSTAMSRKGFLQLSAASGRSLVTSPWHWAPEPEPCFLPLPLAGPYHQKAACPRISRANTGLQNWPSFAAAMDLGLVSHLPELSAGSPSAVSHIHPGPHPLLLPLEEVSRGCSTVLAVRGPFWPTRGECSTLAGQRYLARTGHEV